MSEVKITQYNDISLDGYIAGINDDTSWIPECGGEQFHKIVSENEVILMGRRSYEFAVAENVFPYNCALNLIMTHDVQQLQQGEKENIVFSDGSPEEVVNLIKDKGYKKVFLMGGGRLNAAFLNVDLVDEIILTIHPIVLGGGTKLYEGLVDRKNFALVSQKSLSGGSQVFTFKVNRHLP